jgi:YidC/Oxa1 family membrane protein insertase
MIYLYNEILFRPLLNLMVFFYNTIAFKDLGLAIILLTVLIRLILYPLFQRITRHQLVMQELQPKLARIREEHKDNPEKQTHATLELFRENKVNPFSGFFLMLVQFPVLIALYQIFQKIFSADIFARLYSFVPAPGELHVNFLGLINLQNSSILLVGLAAILQYVQTRLSLPKLEPGKELSATEKATRNMAFIGPIIIALVFAKLPAALALYLVATTAFSIFQQQLINRQLQHEKLERIRNGAGGKNGV